MLARDFNLACSVWPVMRIISIPSMKRGGIVGIRRRDEHHAGEVLLGLEIVIEGMVLFGSENLKQHRRQIAAEIGADLVHVVCWGRPKIEGEVLSDAPALSQC